MHPREHRRMRSKRPVYLDYPASTPLHPRVLSVMLGYLRESFGNPHAVHHAYGWHAAEALERSRAQTAALLGALPEEVIFTSGATESNNLAIRGAARCAPHARRHAVTCATEHRSVLAPAEALKHDGVEITVVPVGSDGLIDLNVLEDAIRHDTLLTSVMAVNNEIGVVQPLAEIGALCAARGALFHTDAAQAAGKMVLDVEAMHIDLLSLSAHKIYGPMGIGALYVRNEARSMLAPLLLGGGQEKGLRSGTVPTPLAIGLGEACAIAAREMAGESIRIEALGRKLLGALGERLPVVALNGGAAARIPGILNLRLAGIDAEELITECEELALSTASACSSTSGEPSHVLRALGLGDEHAQASFRIGIGRFTTAAEIDIAVESITAGAKRLLADAPGAR